MSLSKSIFALLPGLSFLLAQGACSGDAMMRSDSSERDDPTGGEDPSGEPAADGDPAADDDPAMDGDPGSHGELPGGDNRQDAATEPPDAGPEIPLEAEPEKAELLVSLTDGTVMWWHADGTGGQLLKSSIDGPAFGMAFDASSNLYVTHGYAPSLQTGNAIEVFDANADPVGAFGGIYDCNPHSIVFDAIGHAYVGQSDCESDILHLDETGALLESFDVVTEMRGADWIALADDQCTMLYTSQGPNVKRYDVCAKAQLANFNVAALPVDPIQGAGAHELKFVPGGGVIVANFTEIVLLDAAGIQVGVYDMPGPDGWRGLDLDVGGTSFWVVNHSTSDVVRFDIASGEILERFNTGTAPLTVKSVVVNRL